MTPGYPSMPLHLVAGEPPVPFDVVERPAEPTVAAVLVQEDQPEDESNHPEADADPVPDGVVVNLPQVIDRLGAPDQITRPPQARDGRPASPHHRSPGQELVAAHRASSLYSATFTLFLSTPGTSHLPPTVLNPPAPAGAGPDRSVSAPASSPPRSTRRSLGRSRPGRSTR